LEYLARAREIFLLFLTLFDKIVFVIDSLRFFEKGADGGTNTADAALPLMQNDSANLIVS